MLFYQWIVTCGFNFINYTLIHCDYKLQNKATVIIKSSMNKLFSDLPEAIANSLVIARRDPGCVICLGDSFHDSAASERLTAGASGGTAALPPARTPNPSASPTRMLSFISFSMHAGKASQTLSNPQSPSSTEGCLTKSGKPVKSRSNSVS